MNQINIYEKGKRKNRVSEVQKFYLNNNIIKLFIDRMIRIIIKLLII